MKRMIVLLTALLMSLSVFSQGIEFQQKSYAEVLNVAQKEKKLVFVDIYTSWCGPCKHMSKEIFPQAAAGDFFNVHFLNMQLDAEKSEDGKMIAQKFGVSAYPTFLFVNGNGELVYRFLGGRTVDELIEEGKKALEAFKVQPELKKYAKKYEKGKRDKDFLEQYFILKDKAGLDCSDILLDYFAQVDDAGLLDTINLSRIAKITVFDSDFANRVMDAVCQKAENGEEKEVLSRAAEAAATYLGACLKSTAKSDDESDFESVLSLKKQLFAATGLAESVTKASLGGGNIYVPSELSSMDYYFSKKKVEKFNATFLAYLKHLQTDFAKRQEEMNMAGAVMKAKMDSAKIANNQEEYNTLKKLRAMMMAFSGVDNYYISTSMIDNVEKYDELYTGEKNESYQKQLADWYVFLHAISPSAKTAVYVADKLLELDKKQLAIEVLNLGLEQGSEGMGVEESDVIACKKKLEELR